ncbi:unnamed protein product [Caenorhabditis bovis]|uniref:PH domain-containing protein n=1 Tax=Caenorhabditis bovis TaxID=2654633 RepID=A0A8S1EM00_9PELO|nr:unnamed protein product [Caenorhabditis bovis]
MKRSTADDVNTNGVQPNCNNGSESTSSKTSTKNLVSRSGLENERGPISPANSMSSPRKPPNLEEIDKRLEELHELAENALMSTSLGSGMNIDQTLFDTALLDSTSAILRKCETLPGDLTKASEEGVLEEVEEAVRDAEEKQMDRNHASMLIDTEYSSDDEIGRRYNELYRTEPDTLFNTADSGLSLRTTSNRRTRHRISSNATLHEFQSSSIGHERARSNDSRSTSLFSSSLASFRRPLSHFSIDNSCFDMNEAPVQHSLMCTPVEKIYVKNSRSAPEMRLHETKINTFQSTPSPSNEGTSEISVSSELSSNEPTSSASALPAVSNLQLRPTDGLAETSYTSQESPKPPPRPKRGQQIEKRKKMSGTMIPTVPEESCSSITQSIDLYMSEPQAALENRSVEIITVQISNLNLVKKLKKSLCVTAKLDTTDVHRSANIKIESTPLFHEFNIETMESFSHLHIIFLEGSFAILARPVGKVSIPRKNFVNRMKLEHTLKLGAVSKYPEFCGQICVDIRRKSRSFAIRVVDCGGLKLTNSPTLLLLVSTIGSATNLGKLTIDAEQRRSKEWLEMPCSDGLLSLKMTLWQDLLKGINSVFHGQVRVDIDERWEAGPAKWFYLRAKTHEKPEIEEIGDVLVKTSHQIDHILRLHVYKPLLDILSSAGTVYPITASIYAVIESLPKVELSQISRSLVELLAQSDNIRPVLNSLYVNNILKCQDENTLFRGQSLAGKMLFEILTSFGRMYLITTLKPVIDKIFKEHKNCEIDPIRIEDGCSLEKNKANLLLYFSLLFDRVTQSSTNCPHFIKLLFFDLREVVKCKTGRVEVQRLAISSFMIMRFFAAAILNPKAFEIRIDQPDLRVSRTLLLLSKMLQRVSNCTVSLGSLSTKEAWLSDVFEKVTSENNKHEMTKFLDNISLTGESNEPEKCTVFKFGNLQKVDKTRLAWKKILQYKHRYVQLTDSHLMWHKDVQLPPQGKMKLSDVRNITVDNKTTITITTDNDDIQFEAAGGNDANDWVLAIEKQRNRSKKESDETTSDPFTFDLERHLDKVHSILYKYRETLIDWIAVLDEKKEMDEKNMSELLMASYVPEEDREIHKIKLQETLKSTLSVMDDIQKAHEEYEKELLSQNQIAEAFGDDEN